VLFCALYDRSVRSAWPEVASGLTPDSIQKKYAKTVVSAWIAPGCVQSLGAEKCFHTAWTRTGRQESNLFALRYSHTCCRLTLETTAAVRTRTTRPLSGSQPSSTGGALRERSKSAMDPNKRNAWLRKLDEECPYQVVLLRQPFGDHEVMRFLDARVGRFDMYAEDDYAICIRYCFADPLDAASFRARFGSRERFKLVG
jgi:hypothetical protein